MCTWVSSPTSMKFWAGKSTRQTRQFAIGRPHWRQVPLGHKFLARDKGLGHRHAASHRKTECALRGTVSSTPTSEGEGNLRFSAGVSLDDIGITSDDTETIVSLWKELVGRCLSGSPCVGRRGLANGCDRWLWCECLGQMTQTIL